jgi:hypothetical protein
VKGFTRVWLVTFLLLLLFGGAWILATPMSGPPDEPTHIMRADAIDHGQLIGADQGAGQPKAVTAVRVPQDLTELQRLSSCFAGKPTTPAGCVQAIGGSQNDVPTRIYVGRYPPLYYFIVGLPSLVLSTPGVVYWMRLFSLTASAIFLSLALAAAWRWSRSRLLIAAVAVAITPMAIYIASSVNPNGMEISVAICLWVTLLLLVEHAEAPPRPLIAAAGVSAIVFPHMRALSPVWEVVIAVTIAGLAWGNGLGSLLHRREIRRWIVASCVSVGIAIAWVVAAGSLHQLPNTPVPAGTTTGHLLALVAGQTGGYLQQFIGVFGALDTASPLVTYLAWIGTTFVVLVLGFAVANLRVAFWLVVTIASSLVIPAILELHEARTNGLIGQGRYYLPMAVGAVLVAGVSAGRVLSDAPVTRRVGPIMIGMVAVGHASAFAWTLHRYIVGSRGPLNPLARVPSGWAPPVNPLALDLLVAVIATAFAAWVIRLTMTEGSEAFDRTAVHVAGDQVATESETTLQG